MAFRCPTRGFDRFRPFSCKSYLLCPSCAQKRTLQAGEYLSENLLLRLPHRQAVQWPAIVFVWTILKVLRMFLRHDRTVDPAQIRKIIACMERHGRGPPPLN